MSRVGGATESTSTSPSNAAIEARTERTGSDPARSDLRAFVSLVSETDADRVAASVAGDVDQLDVAGAVAASGPASTTLLREGSRGPAVSDLQAQLNAKGASLDVDGIFGPQTEAAVRAFQEAHGLQVDGIVGPETRNALERAPSVQDGAVTNAQPVLRQGQQGPEVATLQSRLNAVADSGLAVDGDFGPATRAAVVDFQRRAGIGVDGVVGPETYRALDEVEAGTRELAEPTPVTPTPPPTGPQSRQITVGDNTFGVHDMVRAEFGRTSVPGNRIIAMDSNSVSGREEILPPLIIIPNDATPAERAAAQQSVDQVAQWLQQNLGGDRRSTGIVRTTAENGRGLSGFFHTEFHSVNDSEAVNLIRQNPEAYARILGGTLGQIPGANFIVPHGDPGRWGPDPGAVSADGQTTEVNLAQHVIREGFWQLSGQ